MLKFVMPIGVWTCMPNAKLDSSKALEVCEPNPATTGATASILGQPTRCRKGLHLAGVVAEDPAADTADTFKLRLLERWPRSCLQLFLQWTGSYSYNAVIHCGLGWWSRILEIHHTGDILIDHLHPE